MKHNFLKKSQTYVSRAVKFTSFFSLIAIFTACTSTGPLFLSKKELVNSSDVKDVEYGAPLSGVRIFQNAEAHLARKAGRVFIGKPYQINDQWFYPKVEIGYSKIGRASWYGPGFHGRKTANGEIFDMNHLTAAHPTMPLPSYARVTNLKNGASVIVRVNDRGPFAYSRLIDVSKRTAEILHFTDHGITDVKVDYLGPAQPQPREESYLLASYRGPKKNSDVAFHKDNNKILSFKRGFDTLLSGRFNYSQVESIMHDTSRLSSAYTDEYLDLGYNSDVLVQRIGDRVENKSKFHDVIVFGSVPLEK